MKRLRTCMCSISRASSSGRWTSHVRGNCGAPGAVPKPGALAGVKVLDLSRVLAGPWAAQTLGDLGAEVIKVERPGVADGTRTSGPPFPADDQGQSTGESTYDLCVNRNKRSVSIDFTRPTGQALVRVLATQSDVFIENFKTGGLAAYGLDYASLSALNPRLVYCSITGFGHTGPHAHRASYDCPIQGMGGLMSITGQPDGAPGAGSAKASVALTDILTGLYASTAILAAIQARTHTGRGQHIDLALVDVQALTRGMREWPELPQRHGVSCGPVHTVAGVFADEQVRAQDMQKPQAADIPLVASPMRLSDTPVQYRSAPPQKGQHTLQVLRERLELSQEAIDELTRQGVLG